jgi:hypothetical protein
LIKWSVFLGFCSADRSLSDRLGVLVEVERHVYGWGCDRRGGLHVLESRPVVRRLAAEARRRVLGIDLDRSLLGDAELGADLLPTPAVLVA